MERHSNIKWETMREALLDTTIPYVISLIIFIVTFFRGVEAIEQNMLLFTFLVLVMTVFVLWTEPKSCNQSTKQRQSLLKPET